MLTIETIDDMYTVRCVGTNDVWVFDSDFDARVFVDTFFAPDVSVEPRPWRGVVA